MKSNNYSNYSVIEAAQIEMTTEFVKAVKLMNSDLVKSRLAALLAANPTDITFLNIVGQFNSLIESKTSADV